MTIFNSNFDYEIEDYIKDNDGRYLICILKVNNEKILLVNYYGLNSDEIYLLEDFCNRIEHFNDMPIVRGGDWNLIIENIDKPEALKSLYRSPGNKKKPIGPM